MSTDTTTPAGGQAPSHVNVTIAGKPTADPTTPSRPRRTRATTAMGRAVEAWHWRHTPVHGVLNLAGATLSAAGTGHVLGMPAAVGVAGTAGGIAAACVAGAIAGHGRRRLAWRCACWLTSGGWATWALATTPWATTQLGVLAAGTLSAAVMAPELTRSRNRGDATAPTADPNDPEVQRERLALNWEKRIKRVCNIEVKVLRVAVWETGTGYTLDVRMPSGGASWRDLADAGASLADDADLPHGCGVTGKPGMHRRRSALLDVATHNALRDFVRMDDTSPRRIADPVELGRFTNAAPVLIEIEQECIAVVGQTGSGKTNLLHVLTGQLARCVDVLHWHIDIAGGGLSLPWVLPAHEGQAAMPGIDWCATTLLEAEIMCRVAIQILEGRKRVYARRMRDANTAVLPVDQELPHIVITVDEGGRLNNLIRDLLITISDTGRGTRVRTTYSGLRGVDDYLPTEIKEQARVRIGMRVTDEKELAFLFGWGHGLDPEAIPYRGCGFVYEGDETSQTLAPFKAGAMLPDDITRFVIETASYRPAMDDASVRLADSVEVWADNKKLCLTDAYSGRWARTLPLLLASEEDTDTTTDTDGGATMGATPDQPTGGGSSIEHLFEVNPKDTPRQAYARYQKSLDDLRAAAGDTAGGDDDEGTDREAEARDAMARELAELAPGFALPDAEEPAPAPPADPRPASAGKPPARLRYQQILHAAGVEGTGATEITAELNAAGYPTVRTTVQGWLAADQAAGLTGKNAADRWMWTAQNPPPEK